MSWAEVKSEGIYLLNRKVIEPVLMPGIRLPIRVATPESAETWAKQNNFREAALDYHSLVESAYGLNVRKEALINLSQQLINLGQFRQARSFLRQAEAKLEILNPSEVPVYKAQIAAQRGWIADYEHGYKDSYNLFSETKALIRGSGSGIRLQWPKMVQELDSTATHFQGRAKFGQAQQGIEPTDNCKWAIAKFSEAIGYDEGSNLKVGFGHAWLARCYNLMGEYWTADDELEEMGRLFTENSTTDGSLAHYYVLHGSFQLQRGSLDVAMTDFQTARKIRLATPTYPKGLSDANWGLAAVYARRGEVTKGLPLIAEAVRSYPAGLFSGIIGG